MSTSVKPPARCIAVLKFPKYKVDLTISCARNVLARMTGNPNFPSPRPPLAAMQDVIDALAEAQTAARLGGKAATAVRDVKLLALRMLFEQVRSFVQSVADSNPAEAASIIESAGMYVKKVRTAGKRGLRLRNGRVSGEVDAFVDWAGNRASYDWEFSLDECVTFVAWRSTTEANTTLTGLPVGAVVWVRFRTLVKNVYSDWSDPVSILVT